MAKKNKGGVKTGYKPTPGKSGVRYTNRHRAVGLLAQLLELDADLLVLIDDWQEGFKVGGTSAGGNQSGGVNSRTLNEAIRGMVDHDKKGKASVIPLREGHGLADETLQLHNEIRDVVRDIARLARKAKRVTPMPAGVADLKLRAENTADAGAGYCEVKACLHLCTGHINDIRRTGFCPACYKAWRRNLASDHPQSRVQFVDTRVPRRDVTVTSDEDEAPAYPPHAAQMSVPSQSTSSSSTEERSA